MRELTTGEPISGNWLDQTAKYRSELRGEERPIAQFQMLEQCDLASLPCWAHLTPHEYRKRIRDLIAEVEHETRERHAEENTEPRGRAYVLRQNPHQRPNSVKTSPAPRIHARAKRARERYRQAYAWFLAAYHEASRKFREGDLTVEFPPGCFRPRAPFSPPARAPV